MLGYNTFANKLASVVASGVISAAAGAAYALLFGYVGSTFASVQYSILPLLWVLAWRRLDNARAADRHAADVLSRRLFE